MAHPRRVGRLRGSEHTCILDSPVSSMQGSVETVEHGKQVALMTEKSLEQQVWDHMVTSKNWNFIGTVPEFIKEDHPSVGTVPATVALALGSGSLLFSQGEVSPIGDSTNFSISLTLLADNGLYFVNLPESRRSALPPKVTWRPFSEVSHFDISSNKSWWADAPDRHFVSVTLHLAGGELVELVGGRSLFNSKDDLLQAVGVIRSQIER